MSAARFEARDFRRALGQFPTGVCVVTAAVDDRPLGMTMSSFNSLSLDPPLVLFSIDRRAASLPQWERAESYAVHVLAENQRDISNRFARPLSAKWEGVDFRRGKRGPPILSGVAALFECVPWARHDAGDHRLFIAEVADFRVAPDRAPLVFGKGRYASLQAAEAGAAPLWPLDIHY
jgi:flavin reductase (DIM6/NTAB) family NADH-FMN oxidoreductase RutF